MVGPQKHVIDPDSSLSSHKRSRKPKRAFKTLFLILAARVGIEKGRDREREGGGGGEEKKEKKNEERRRLLLPNSGAAIADRWYCSCQTSDGDVVVAAAAE